MLHRLVYLGMSVVDVQPDFVPHTITNSSQNFKSKRCVHVATTVTTAIDDAAMLELQ